MSKLRIAPQVGRAGRVFTVNLLNMISANVVWDVARGSDYTRPVYLAFAGPEQACRAFLANLRTGRRAEVLNEYGHVQGKVEMLRSAGYRYAVQRLAGDVVVVTGFAPPLFEIEPSLSPERVRFVFAPPSWWVEEQASRLNLVRGGRDVAVASLFAAFLDRRVALPILNDSAFHLRLWDSARERKWLELHKDQRSFHSQGPLFVYPKKLVGLELVAVIDVAAEECEEWLQVETRRYFQKGWKPPEDLDAPEPDLPARESNEPTTEVFLGGETGIEGDRGLLPSAAERVEQRGLFDPA